MTEGKLSNRVKPIFLMENEQGYCGFIQTLALELRAPACHGAEPTHANLLQALVPWANPHQYETKVCKCSRRQGSYVALRLSRKGNWVGRILTFDG